MARSGKCKTNLNNFDLSPGVPGPSMPGFGLNIAVPGLDIPFPEGFPENILDLLNKLKLKWPGGIDLSAMLDQFMRQLSQIISNILTQISAFLAVYNIIMAIIQMIVCIIEVLCGLIRKAPKKLKRLFRTCLPLFISIFPFLALLALLLAILALILALIEYIIAIIRKIWDELKRNYENLKKATSREQTPGKSAAMIAITRKIASILCVLENIMLLFLVIMAVIEIIKGMLNRSFSLPCDDRATSGDCNCCSDCSDLIIRPENLNQKPGVLVYSITNPIFLGPEATETITMTADSLVDIDRGQYSFKNIIETTYKNCSTTLGPFFPPTPISSTYKPNQAPYTIDLDIEHTTMAGTRVLTVKDIVVQWVENDSNPNGKLTLIGGKIEDPLDELTDETLLFLFNNGTPPVPIPGPNPPDVPIDCIINEFKPNYDVLSAMGLTTFDCNPEIINDKLAFYTSLDGPDINDVVLPDIEKAMSDYTDAIAELRSKINEDSIDKFRDRMNEIMGDLKDQTEDAYSNVLQTMTNPLYCTATLTPEIQFISGKIRVVVSLKSASKQTFKDVIGEATVPEKAKTDIIAKLKGETTLGSLSTFQYDDATGTFFADISSGIEGDGVLKLYYDNQQFGQLVVPENLNENSRIEALEFPYTFIGGTIESDGATRRDESDVSNN